jgi:ATP-binding cassette subfamily B protein
MSATQQEMKQTVRYFWHKAWRYKPSVLLIAAVLPINVIANQILPPLILANVLDRLSRHDYQDGQVWSSFGSELVVYGILVLFGGSLLWRVVDYTVWRLEGRVTRDIAQQVFGHLQQQSASFHANNFGGSLVSQTNKLIGGYIRVQDTTIFQVLPLILGMILSVAVLSASAPWYALVLFLFSAAYAYVAIFVTRRVRVLGTKHASRESAQTGYLADAVTNAMAIKSFAGYKYENRRFARVTEQTRESLLRLSRAHQKQMIYFGTLLGTISALSLTFAVMGVLVFNANIATVFLIFNYTANIAEQLFQFGNSALRSYNRALGDAVDMVRILGTEPEVQDTVAPEKVRIRNGKIEFRQVVFTHDGSNDALFDGLDLRINPGEKVGLVGHSGSGKTTFTRVLLRFSDIDSGEITIDGQNIAAIRQDDLHRHIAYVPQEPLLFHRSIADNIRYGDPEASMEAVREVAKLAHADDFVDELPAGYETLVGERGVKLSGGQRQRIAIARAMLKNAPILVLDEATSALDSESEALIQDALWKLMEGRTAIVIAHRLSTIQHMDRIIVMDNGEIVEQGSHKELLKSKGAYAKLWARQSGGFIED